MVDGTGDLFQISVKRDPDNEDHWNVSLPHSCNRWDITESAETYDSLPHSRAEEALEEFIAEAQRALANLRLRQEQRYPHDY